MRILVLSDRYPPYYEGGYEINCEEAVNGLKQRGYQVFVLTTKYGVNKAKIDKNVFRLLECCEWEIVINIHKRYLQAQLKRAVMFRRNYWITKRIIKKILPDIVYVWQLRDASILPVIAVQKQGIPCVFEIEDYSLMKCKAYYDLKHGFLRRLLRSILTGVWNFNSINFNNMKFVSEAVKRKYVSADFRGVNFIVIPSGVECRNNGDETIHREKDSSGIRLLYSGRLIEEKGVHIAIEAFAYLVNVLKYKKITLDIIGTGNDDYIKKLKGIVISTNLEEIVRFMSKISHDELQQRFRNYDILLFPSIWEEPFARTILEAMAQGLPIVATTTGGTPELITHGWNSLLVPPNDSIKMAEAIRKLIDNPPLYEQISINEIRKIREKYTNEKIIEQIEKYIIEEVQANEFKEVCITK